MHPETREAQSRRSLRGLQQAAESEELRVVRNRARACRTHLEDIDVLPDTVAAVEKLHFEQGLAAPQRAFGAKPDVAVLIVAESGERRR